MPFGERTIDEFLSDVASSAVTPAGGTAAAVVGATGAALCEMVCVHTVAKDDHPAALADVRDDLHATRATLLDLADRDAEAVDALLAASDGSAATAAKRATGVPLAIAEACLTVVENAVVVTELGTPNAVPDAATGAFLARGALDAAVFTVRYNARRIEDPAFAEEMAERTADVEADSAAAFEQVLSTVGTER